MLVKPLKRTCWPANRPADHAGRLLILLGRDLQSKLKEFIRPINYHDGGGSIVLLCLTPAGNFS